MAFCAFYKGVWVTTSKKYSEIQNRGNGFLQYGLRNGHSLKEMGKLVEAELECMQEQLSKGGGGFSKTLWGEDNKENVELWCAGVYILMRLNIIKNDEENGFGIKIGDTFVSCVTNA